MLFRPLWFMLLVLVWGCLLVSCRLRLSSLDHTFNRVEAEPPYFCQAPDFCEVVASAVCQSCRA